MVCKDAKDAIFEAALLGVAPGEGMEAHLASCTGCKQEFESLRSTMGLLDTWTAPEPSPYFDVRLRARLREVKEEEQSGRAASWLERLGLGRLTWKPVAAAAFAVILAAGGGLYRFGFDLTQGAHQPVVQAACPVVDLQALDNNQQVLNELQDLDDDNSGSGSVSE